MAAAGRGKDQELNDGRRLKKNENTKRKTNSRAVRTAEAGLQGKSLYLDPEQDVSGALMNETLRRSHGALTFEDLMRVCNRQISTETPVANLRRMRRPFRTRKQRGGNGSAHKSAGKGRSDQ